MIRDDADNAIAVQPLALGRLLRLNGWTKDFEDDVWAVWHKQLDDGEAEVQLPQDIAARDFDIRLQQAVDVLTRVEKWSSDDLHLSLMGTGMDMIVWRFPDADGRLPLAAAAGAIDGLRGLVLAAASAAVEPRSVYRTVKPAQATEYLDDVDLVAPERGSFVLRALSPVASVLNPQRPLIEGLEDPPFSRRAVEQLHRAVAAASVAARAVIEQDDGEAFTRAVGDGVSANLCESLVQLADATDERSLEMHIRFASVRPSTLFPTRTESPRLRLGALEVEQIGEAARVFRQREPEYDVEIQGAVVHLHRAESVEEDGEVTLSTWFDGAMRQIRFTFGPAEYRRLLQAHDEGALVTIRGDVLRRGPRLVGERGRVVHIGPPAED